MMRKNNCTQRTVPSGVYDKHYYWEENGPGGWRRFLETRGRYHSQNSDYLRSLGKLKDGMRVLDLGCGRGEFIFHCTQDHQVLGVGIDYSATAMEIASGTVYQFGTDEQKVRMLFVRADAQHLPFPDRSFDVVFSHHVVEHLYSKQLERMLDECSRLIREGGRLLIETGPNLWRLRYGFRITRLAYRIPSLGQIYHRMMEVEEIPLQAKTPGDAHSHVGEQSVLSLKRALQRNGFECKAWVGLGKDSRFTREIFQKRLGWTGTLLYYIYYFLYGMFPFNLVFGDVVYALAWPERR